MARWRGSGEGWPGPLREFHEEDWPPVPGECLKHYACRADGYGADCVPPGGRRCGDAFYAMLAADYPDDAGLVARHRRGDAFERFHQARLAWIGEGNDGYITEFIDGVQRERAIRYGR